MLEAKDRRNNTRHIDLERQVRALRLHHLATLLAPCVVHRDAALRALHVNHEDDRGDTTKQHHDRCNRRHFTGSDQFGCTSNSAWQSSDNTGQDNHRDTVTDTALGDLLTQPHQEYRTRNQRDAGRNQERRAGNNHQVLVDPAARMPPLSTGSSPEPPCRSACT